MAEPPVVERIRALYTADELARLLAAERERTRELARLAEALGRRLERADALFAALHAAEVEAQRGTGTLLAVFSIGCVLGFGITMPLLVGLEVLTRGWR